MVRVISICVFIMIFGQSLAQEILWISEKSSIILRDDLNGFEKINDSTYQMIGIDEPCIEGEKSVIIDGVGTFSSMPCFRDYLLSQENKIIVWGKLSIEGEVEKVHNWENNKIDYYGRWRGATLKGSPGDGCKCSFSDQVGDSAVFNFFGTGIQLWGERNPHENTADIYIDGNKIATANQYQKEVGGNDQVLMYKVTDLGYGPHSIKVVVTGEDTNATGNYFVIHNFVILDDREIDKPDVEDCEPDTIYIPEPYPVYDTIVHYQVRYDTLYIPSDTIREIKNFYHVPSVNAVQGQLIWEWEVIEIQE